MYRDFGITPPAMHAVVVYRVRGLIRNVDLLL